VIGSLPAALARLGHSARVMLPHHGVIDDTVFGIQPLETFTMAWNGATTQVEVSAVERDGVTHYFLRGWPYFAPNDRFIYHRKEGIDIGRFLFLAAAALELTRRIGARHHWRPDVFHAHDWHTAGLPYLLESLYHGDPIVGDVATLFTVHNMQYQGWGAEWHLARAGLPPVDHPLLVAMDKTDAMLALGLAYSTMLSTVSPRYAEEIALPEDGHGLDGLTHARSKHLMGVLNGIDTERWNPATSRHLKVNYDADTLSARAKNKSALQAELGLQKRAKKMLFGSVMRLVDQKGPAILFPAARRMLETTDCQFVLLGAGQPEHEKAVLDLAAEFPGRAVTRVGFDEALSERIYAGIDVFVMPSLFEPCGIGQMIAMRYGALPLTSNVGGLADTVDETVGFVTPDHSVDGLATTLANALEVYDHDRTGWRKKQLTAMRRDFSWQHSAQAYSLLYQQAVDLRRAHRH